MAEKSQALENEWFFVTHIPWTTGWIEAAKAAIRVSPTI